MKKRVPAILFFLFLVFVLARSGATVTGNDLVRLKKAGISDRTIQLIAKEKVIETAALSVDDIVNMKKMGERKNITDINQGMLFFEQLRAHRIWYGNPIYPPYQRPGCHQS